MRLVITVSVVATALLATAASAQAPTAFTVFVGTGGSAWRQGGEQSVTVFITNVGAAPADIVARLSTPSLLPMEPFLTLAQPAGKSTKKTNHSYIVKWARVGVGRKHLVGIFATLKVLAHVGERECVTASITSVRGLPITRRLCLPVKFAN